MVHCFTGTRAEAQTYLAMGLDIGARLWPRCGRARRAHARNASARCHRLAVRRAARRGAARCCRTHSSRPSDGAHTRKRTRPQKHVHVNEYECKHEHKHRLIFADCVSVPLSMSLSLSLCVSLCLSFPLSVTHASPLRWRRMHRFSPLAISCRASTTTSRRCCRSLWTRSPL